MDDEWDKEIEQDVAEGRIDALLREAVAEVEAGLSTPLLENDGDPRQGRLS
jgi:hypothetical protein